MGEINNVHKKIVDFNDVGISNNISTTNVNTSTYGTRFCEQFHSGYSQVMSLSPEIRNAFKEMVNDFDDLRESGSINTEDQYDYKSRQIISNMEKAKSIAEKRDKSFEEIHDFVYIYEDFKNMYNNLKGGGDCAQQDLYANEEV